MSFGAFGWVLCGLALLSTETAAAEPTLQGRLVTFNVLTYDVPAKPYLQAQGRTVQVGDGIEFGLEPEGIINGLDVLPVTVQISPRRIEANFKRGEGVLFDAVFNGYVLRFETDCALFEAVSIDSDFTTMPLTPAAIHTERGALFINMAGLAYAPDKRFALNIEVGDCALERVAFNQVHNIECNTQHFQSRFVLGCSQSESDQLQPALS